MQGTVGLVLLFCCYAIHFPCVKTKEKQEIHVGALVPFLETHDEYCFYSAMSVAVEMINKDDRILRDYKLVVHYKDSTGSLYNHPTNILAVAAIFFGLLVYDQAKGQNSYSPPKVLTLLGFALVSFFKFLNMNLTMQALLGPAFSYSTEAVAIQTNKRKIPQITYAALTPLKKDTVSHIKPSNSEQKKFPFFLRTTPSLTSYFRGMAVLFETFKWKRIAILYEYSRHQFFTAANELSSHLTSLGYTTVALQGFSDTFLNVEAQFDALKAADAKVIVGIFGQPGARKIFCEAYKRKMFHPHYQWIVLNQLQNDWFEDVNYLESMNCTRDQYIQVAHGYLKFIRSYARRDNITPISGKSPKTTWELIKTRKLEVWYDHWVHRNPNDTVPAIPEQQFYENSMFAFDAVYVLAMAFDKILRKFGSKALMTKYDDEEKAKLLTQTMLNSRFEGVTGRISFDRSMSDERLGELILQQARIDATNQTRVIRNIDVGVYKAELNKLDFFKGERYLFDGSKVPKDRSFEKFRLVRVYGLSVISTLWGLAVIGIAMSLFFLFINIYFRNVRLIKMSSPNINNGIIAGCIICYVSVIIYGLDTRTVTKRGIMFACNTVTLTLSLGFTMAFGCLFSKTWRIYRIFTAAKTMERVAIKDSHLYAVILFLLSIDLVVFTLWITLSPFYVMEQELETKHYHEIREMFFFHKCSCKYQLHFTVATYGYKGLLLIFGLFLAWETRSVTIPVLNDSKHIGMSVYNVCVVSAIGVTCASALYSNHDYVTGYIVVSMCIFVCTTGTLLLIFVPKIYLLFGRSSDRPNNSDKPTSQITCSTYRSNRRSSRRSVDDRTASLDSQSDSIYDRFPLKFHTYGNEVYATSRCVKLNGQKHKGYVWNPPPLNNV